jgi:hypothetical protein
MAITQDDVDRLERALMRGELTVEYDGVRTTFRSVEELKTALDYARGRLNVAQGKPSRTTQTHAQFTRG